MTTSYTKFVIVSFRLLYDDCGCAETVGKGGFSKDICRSMIAMLDADHSGKLGFDEFKTLWTDIRHWKVIKLVFFSCHLFWHSSFPFAVLCCNNAMDDRLPHYKFNRTLNNRQLRVPCSVVDSQHIAYYLFEAPVAQNLCFIALAQKFTITS